VPVDEHVEVDRVEVAPRGIREPRDVPRSDRAGYPRRVASACVGRARLASTAGDAAKPREPRARQRFGHGVADAEEPAPRRGLAREQPLTDLGERDDREVDHRVRGEQVEVGHRLVRARDEPVDLARLLAEQRVVAREVVGAG
jgi:hypothetical protein